MEVIGLGFPSALDAVSCCAFKVDGEAGDKALAEACEDMRSRK